MDTHLKPLGMNLWESVGFYEKAYKDYIGRWMELSIGNIAFFRGKEGVIRHQPTFHLIPSTTTH